MTRSISSGDGRPRRARRRVVVATPRLALVLVDEEEMAAIRDARRAGRRWARDYPTPGDRLVARSMLEGGPLPSAAEPWGLLQVVLRRGGLAVGGIGAKGRPAGGEVEVGYGLAPSVHGRGVATEALAAFVEMSRARGLRALIAETDRDNLASQRVLRKNGFAETHREGDAIWWRLDIPRAEARRHDGRPDGPAGLSGA